MKRYELLLSGVAGLCALVSGACKDDETVVNQMQFGTSGCITLQLDYQKTDTLVQVGVVNRNQLAGSVELSLFSEEELNAYNAQWNTHYRLMPTDTYALEQYSVTFGTGENEKSIGLRIYPDKLYDYLLTQMESADSYCLPLVMSDPAGGSDRVLYVANLSYPQMCVTSGLKMEIPLETMESDVQVETSLYYEDVIIANGQAQEFGLRFPEVSAEWLANFNAGRETACTLIPEGYYTVSQIQGGAADRKCTGTIRFDRRPSGKDLLAEGSYVLPLIPIRIDETSAQMKYDTIAIVVNNPKHVFTSSDKVDRSGWRIVFCNSDMGVWNSDGIISNILDGDTRTFWASWYAWQGGQETWWNDNGRGNDWCDYGLQFMTYKEQNGVWDMFSEGSRHFLSDDYIFIAGNRDYPTFVVDMGREYYVSEVGMQHRAQIQWAQTKAADIYISNDKEFKLTTMRDGGSALNYDAVNENNWVHVGTIRTERTQDEFWTVADLNGARVSGASKGRFLKFVSREVLPEGNEGHDNSLQYAGVGELYVKEVATIDGEPVK